LTVGLSALLLTLVQAGVLLTGTIDSRAARHLDFSATKVLLNHGQAGTGFVDNMGNFNLYVESSAAGTYRLDVVNLAYHFEPVVIEISE
jgi:hypothetical protein